MLLWWIICVSERFVCREVLQILGRAADIGISYNTVLIVEDHSLICKYVLNDLVQTSL